VLFPVEANLMGNLDAAIRKFASDLVSFRTKVIIAR
jgi:hypothetical protein